MLRRLPDFLVIGGMRSGTSSFFYWLSEHPEMTASNAKEVHFFDWHFDRGEAWYRAFFPLRSKATKTFEATPSYMTYLGAAERASSVVPQARIVALLRDPVERAWSHFRLRRATDRDHRDFGEAIRTELAAEPPALFEHRPGQGIPYLVGGMYAQQLEPWIAAFGSDNVLVLDADAMFSDPGSTIAQFEDFAGIRRLELPKSIENAAPPDTPDAETMELLADFYQEPNRHLARLTDVEFSWL